MGWLHPAQGVEEATPLGAQPCYTSAPSLSHTRRLRAAATLGRATAPKDPAPPVAAQGPVRLAWLLLRVAASLVEETQRCPLAFWKA